jgi:DNA invertase Pin-like site-specific DNA recombinase
MEFVMNRKKQASSAVRNIALCYVRLSNHRNENDNDSPERQRANIQLECDRRGWIPEWYEDVDGHRSGQHEKNRPGWLALKSRLSDPDVVAIVANDLARLHRKGWRVGDLIDFADEHNVLLVMAAPGRNLDLSGPMGRMSVMIAALMDEYYAVDISRRAKDSIQHRKRQGKVINIPFGTRRNADGYLEPATSGAWWMPDGTFLAGRPDELPDPGALWRGYYESAERILTLYKDNKFGTELIAYQLNIEGWPFRDRNGVPRPMDKDDVRRVVRLWPEYGGIVPETNSKKRRPEEFDLNNIPFIPERAVFPSDLLTSVARVFAERSLAPRNHGVNKDVSIYALNGMTYCAKCEKLAQERNDPRLRSRLSGDKRRYRHKVGVTCGTTNKSVPAAAYEADFGRLIKLLTIREDTLNLMTELAIQADKLRRPTEDEEDPERQKEEAIALCKRRIEAAVVLFGEGRIDREEYRRRVEQNEREIAHWESRTTETEKAALELAMCMDAIEKLSQLWDVGDDEDKQGMARSLFSYVIYDLDARRIVNFRLKPWADRFLTLRSALYEDDSKGKSGSMPGTKPQAEDVTPEGIEPPT